MRAPPARLPAIFCQLFSVNWNAILNFERSSVTQQLVLYTIGTRGITRCEESLDDG